MTQQNKTVRASRPLGSIMMRVAGVMLCLVLFSVHMMGGLYARYSSFGTADDTGRVAKFDVIVAGVSDNAVASKVEASCTKAGEQGNAYAIHITNASEVAVRYTVAVTLNDTVPGVTPVLSGNGGELAVGAVAEQTLTFDIDWMEFTEGATGTAVETVSTEFTVTVYVEQIN